MARRNRAPKRYIEPDTQYNSQLVASFINKLMRNGKKTVAARIFYDALDLVEQRTKKQGIEVFERAVKNATPLIEVRPRRVGGATYQIPIEVRQPRRLALAMRWISSYARQRNENTMAERLAAELMLAANHDGPSIKKKEDTHKMAEANKAFAHFRW